jgi:hypothetical protein
MTDPIKAKIQELCPDVIRPEICVIPDCNMHHCIKKITLAVVLRAILKANPRSYMVDIVGNFWEWTSMDTAPKELGGIGATWNLEHDNYDQQTEECKRFIGSLLGV